jgi:hypothetical protein
MQAFLLERLFETGWKLEGPIFWTLPLATKEAERLIRRKAARRVRVRPVSVDDEAVADVSAERGEAAPHA